MAEACTSQGLRARCTPPRQCPAMAHAFVILAALALPAGVAATGICPRLQEPATALGLSDVPFSITVSFDLAVVPDRLVDNSTYANVRYEVKKDTAVLSSGAVDLTALAEESVNLNIFQTSCQVSLPELSTGMHDLTLSMVGLPKECFTSDRIREEVPFQVKICPTSWASCRRSPPSCWPSSPGIESCLSRGASG